LRLLKGETAAENSGAPELRGGAVGIDGSGRDSGRSPQRWRPVPAGARNRRIETLPDLAARRNRRLGSESRENRDLGDATSHERLMPRSQGFVHRLDMVRLGDPSTTMNNRMRRLEGRGVESGGMKVDGPDENETCQPEGKNRAGPDPGRSTEAHPCHFHHFSVTNDSYGLHYDFPGNPYAPPARVVFLSNPSG
jgi:hypothetical protein